MNWEAIGAVGEIVGALVVVLTLIYLSVQVRQNSKLAMATIRENRIDSSQKIIFALAEASELLVKSGQGEDLSASESMRLDFLMRAMFRDWEGYAYQNHTGLLEDSEWDAMRETWRENLSSPGVREAWKTFGLQYSKVLHKHIEALLNEEKANSEEGT
jgi:hypothetical protein